MTTLNRTIPKSLPPISGLTFNEELHRYHLNNHGWITASTTSILSHGMSPEARERIAATRHVWEPRGNTVHQCLEQHLLGAARCNPGNYGEWVDPLLDHPAWNKYKAIACEHRMWGKTAGIVYAGSCDFVVTDGERVILGDLKTLSSHNSKTRDISAQLGAYVNALNQRHQLQIDKCIGVFAKPGSVEFTVYEPDACVEKWTQAVEDYKASQVPL